jgi:hypothetical protein
MLLGLRLRSLNYNPCHPSTLSAPHLGASDSLTQLNGYLSSALLNLLLKENQILGARARAVSTNVNDGCGPRWKAASTPQGRRVLGQGGEFLSTSLSGQQREDRLATKVCEKQSVVLLAFEFTCFGALS